MKAYVTYSLSEKSEVINLKDYDCSEGEKFEDLPEADRHDIEDMLREQVIVYVDIVTIPD